MITPKLVGFFRELGHGQRHNGLSLYEAISDTARPDEDRMVSYLENGLFWCICLGGYCRDVLLIRKEARYQLRPRAAWPTAP